MPPSMRYQAQQRKKRVEALETMKQSRREALALLKEKKYSYAYIQNATGVSKSTVGLMSKRLKCRDEVRLTKMMESPNQKGRNTILTLQEELMIVERIKLAASRGFAIDYKAIRAIMARIAADGRSGFKNDVPSDDTIRAFRARHRDITYRKAKNKEHAKLNAEHFEHVDSFFNALEDANNLHPGLLQTAGRIWNMDETAVNAVEGRVAKVFTNADSYHGGFRGTSKTYGLGKHVTAVVAVSPLGLKAPPFFIVAGKKLSSRWWAPVKGSFRGEVSGICSRFTRKDWLPSDAVIKVTENGSMEMATMCAFVDHINNYVRQFCREKTYLLCLDGHSSRKGAEWIEKCMEKGCEAVVSPANTSHFLQPCDQTVNRKYKKSLKEIRDNFCKLGIVDTTKINFNIACGVYAFECITPLDITSSFHVTGVFPFQRNFALKFKTANENAVNKGNAERERVHNAGIGNRLKSVIQRRSDCETLKEMKKILASGSEPVRVIQQMSIMLKRTETVNSILMAAGSGRSTECSTKVSQNNEKVVLYDAGAPAEWVTVKEVIQRRRKKEAEDLRAQRKKEAEKRRREEERLRKGEKEKDIQRQKLVEGQGSTREKEAAKTEEKRRKIAAAVEKERQSALRKKALELEKEAAKRVREEAADLGRKIAAHRVMLCPYKGRRGRKRDNAGSERTVPYVL